MCERLVDLDEGVQEWRYRHVKMVERTIGVKLGHRRLGRRRLPAIDHRRSRSSPTCGRFARGCDGAWEDDYADWNHPQITQITQIHEGSELQIMEVAVPGTITSKD